jgi:hypothetical protein
VITISDNDTVHSFGQLVRTPELGPLQSSRIERVAIDAIAELPDGVTVAYVEARDCSQPFAGQCLLNVAYSYAQ